MTTADIGVACGHCKGPVWMVTCREVNGTDHDWTLYSRCDGECGAIHVIESGCLTCRGTEDAECEHELGAGHAEDCPKVLTDDE